MFVLDLLFINDFSVDTLHDNRDSLTFLQRKSTTTGALGAIDTVGTALLKKTDDKTNVSISTPNLKISLDKVDSSSNGKCHEGMPDQSEHQ